MDKKYGRPSIVRVTEYESSTRIVKFKHPGGEAFARGAFQLPMVGSYLLPIHHIRQR